jgi:membrane-associated protease RseP (regulator of RpoE activity)
MHNSPYTPVPPVVSLQKVEAIRESIGHIFLVGNTSLDTPHPGYVRYRGRFLQDPADCFDELRAAFEQHGFTPTIRAEEDGRAALIGLPQVFNAAPSKWQINLVMFVLTVLSTLLTGAFYNAETQAQAFQIWRGWPFSLSIMLILGAHELGHYFAARYHKVAVTLPYFIPLPLISPIGTMGAFIRLKAPVKNRRALLDIGVAGPLAGLIFAVPILFYGLYTSQVGPISATGLLEGNSLLYAFAKIIVFGRMLPGGGQDVFLNQVAWAGWVGLLVTGLNLMPVGQLDGGHVMYTLIGKKAGQLFVPVIAGLVGLALFSFLMDNTFTWGIWIVLLYFFGRVHAEPLDDVTLLDGKRRWIAIFTLVLFILVFVPLPFRILG